MRALFLPSYLGGGYGHIGRCQALAEELTARGWETGFALNGPHAGKLEGAGKIFLLEQPASAGKRKPGEAAFTVISGLSYQLLRDGLDHPGAIRAALREQLGVIGRFRPDVLVADSWPLAGILARLTGLPLAQITRLSVYPACASVIWWQPPPESLVQPDPRPLFNPLLESWGLPAIDQAEGLLRGDLYLVPSLPALEPIPAPLAETYYVGPLVRRSTRDKIEGERRPGEGRKLVYVTTGGGAENVGGVAFYRAMLEALAGLPVQAVVSTGNRVAPQELPPPPARVQVVAWVDGPRMVSQADLVVYSGGYGTSMENLLAGTPGLVIPFHSEQESNGRRLEAAGAARVLLPAQTGAITRWHTWNGRRFSTIHYPQSQLDAGMLREAIGCALDDPQLAEGARRLQAQARQYQGAVQAASLVESLVGRQGKSSGGWGKLGAWQKFRLRH
jgi:UDP:flavonoid glycosyltransferase YjiC (YdhE family)